MTPIRTKRRSKRTGEPGNPRRWLLRAGAFPWFALGIAVGSAALSPSIPSARADDPAVEFTAEVDRSDIAREDSVSLKMNVKVDGSMQIAEPTFSAPDFEVVNEYNGTFVESYYENGRFGVRNNFQITKVLRPNREGDLKITGIQVTVGGKKFTAPDQIVHVGGAAPGTPPPKGYGGGGIGLRGGSKNPNSPNVFVRAEVNKDHVFKGEQIIVSYYLYERVRVFNIQVDKFPVLNGFLREDLDMPVLGTHLDSESVVVDGVPYRRALLLRYAAYPLQEGSLQIDSVALKYNYYANRSVGGDDEDPFMNFFQQLTPLAGTATSEQSKISVQPLPTDGKPSDFTGGVGDFNVASAVDKYEVRANEAVNLTVKIEGRGNLAAIGEPHGKWPDSVELFDTKGHAKAGKEGVGEKDFEFLLIPRAPGKLTLPAMEFSFFDPAKKAYYTRSTEAIQLNVLDPAPGSALVVPRKNQGSASSGSAASTPSSTEDVFGLKAPGSLKSESSRKTWGGQPLWRWLYWVCGLTFLGLAAFVVTDQIGKFSKAAGIHSAGRDRGARRWQKLRALASSLNAGSPSRDVIAAYESLSGAVFDALDRAYGLGARALPRSELKELLVTQRGLSEQLWERIGKLLEFAEMVRFASSAGAVSEQSARGEFSRWVSEGESIVRVLNRFDSGH